MFKKTSIPILNLEYCSDVDLWEASNERQFVHGLPAQRIINELESRGLYEKNLFYRGFDSGRIKQVIKNGTDRDKNSRIWFNNQSNDESTKNTEAPEQILYAVREGGGVFKICGQYRDELEEAVKYAYNSQWKGFISSFFGIPRKDFAISVYHGEDLISIKSREELGEYFLRKGGKPIAIILLSKT